MSDLPPDPSAQRRSYERGSLTRDQLDSDPMAQFRAWFADATGTPEVVEPNAMTLSTVDAEGQPSSRTVLLKAFDERGFVFFTNYESRKAREIADNPRVALLFPWLALERQVGGQEQLAGRVGAEPVAQLVATAQDRRRGSHRPAIGRHPLQPDRDPAGRALVLGDPQR